MNNRISASCHRKIPLFHAGILTFVVMTVSTVLSVAFNGCVGYDSVAYQRELNVRLADTLASKETVTLYYNLREISKHRTIFGHQNSTEYGVLWSGDSLRSDVKDVLGSFPGLYGWDFESMPQTDSARNNDRMLRLVKDAYRRGGINTFSWHIDNPVTDHKYFDTTTAVRQILPGGRYFKKYLRELDSMVDYDKKFVDDHGNPIPIIYRPFHEFDGNWFWWGKNYCTSDEFIRLWQMTVEYLRTYKNVRNYLYAFSPDCRFKNEADLLSRYPGDDYVDIIGMDDYYDFTVKGEGPEGVKKKLKIIASLARRKNKVAAFTETGQETVPDSLWWTHSLYPTINADSVNIAYVMLWRNARKTHYYVPFPGDKSVKDFIEFRKEPKLMFEEDLPDIYHTILPDDSVNIPYRRKQ